MSDQDKRGDVPPTGTAAVVARMVAEHFAGRPNDNAEITATWDGWAGTLTIVVKPASPVVAGEHVFAATIDTTVPTAPENIFMPTENPDGTMTTKIPADHPAARIIGGEPHLPGEFDRKGRYG